MSDLIERQAAVDYWRHIIDATSTDDRYNTGFVDGLEFCISHLSTMSPAQPERKKGEWVYGENDVAMCDGYRCSECGFFVPWDYRHEFIDFIKDYNFCPNCGTDMRGKQDEETD